MIEKTRQEVEDLKQQWLSDPCWDIKHTEGFEAHARELSDFSEAMWAKWSQEDRDSAYRFADLYGVPGNLEAGRKFRALEDRIYTLERKISKRE